MTPEDPDDDRTVIRPPGPTGVPPATGFAKTEWSAGHGTAPHQPPAEDMGSGLPVGTRLGEFEITSLLGEGGFGIVYLAHDHSLQRRVALKEYMPSSLAATLAAAFSGRGSIMAGPPPCPANTACKDEYGAAVLRFETLR